MAKAILLTGGGGSVYSSDLSAAAANVLSGKTYVGSDTDDEAGSGSMPNRGAVSASLNCGNSYTIPAGYHNGAGKISANSLKSQTQANAGAGQILTGYNAYVNGSKVNGSMPNRGNVGTKTLNCGSSYTIPAGYHNGSGKVVANSLASQTQATAAAGDIVAGKTAYVNGSKITGTRTDTWSGRQSFDGATFDGTLLTGVASGTLIVGSSHRTLYNGTLYTFTYTTYDKDDETRYIAFNPCIHLGPFKSVTFRFHVTVKGNINWVNADFAIECYASRVNGSTGQRTLDPIADAWAFGLQPSKNSENDYTVTLDTSSVSEYAFLVVQMFKNGGGSALDDYSSLTCSVTNITFNN